MVQSSMNYWLNSSSWCQTLHIGWGRQYSQQLNKLQQIEDNLAVINNILPAFNFAALFLVLLACYANHMKANGGNFFLRAFLAFNAIRNLY